MRNTILFFTHFLIFFCFSPLTPDVMAKLRINEVLASNGSVNMDPDNYGFRDWIEIFNNGTQAVDLGDYYLTDNPDDLTKWKIPPGTSVPRDSFIIFWADGLDSALHTNFSLSADGESVILVSPYYMILDSITFSAQIPDRSLGRNPDDPKRWSYFDYPTPGLPNHKKSLASSAGFCQPPQFSHEGGFYDESFFLKLSGDNSNDTIRYTTNGAEPDTNSSLYQEPINIYRKRVIRAKVFSESKFNSRTVTHTYFINSRHDLPVVSIATKPAYLWNPTYGIYTKGTNGAVGPWGDTANYYRKWERPGNVEYFDTHQKCGFNEKAGVELSGFLSRRCNPIGLAVSFKGKYGISELDYRLFSSRKTSRLKDFMIRNAGCFDLYFTHFRDAMMNTLVVNQMDIDYQAYEPAVIYLNGSYWGVLNLREKVNRNYPAVIHDADPDNIDFLETYKELLVVAGDGNHYDNLISYVTGNDMRGDEAYRYVRSQIDMPEFLNYFITQVYFCNADWPGNNMKMWRPKNNRGKWRWILSDVEAGFQSLDQSSYDNDALLRLLSPDDVNDNDNWNQSWSTLLFRKLMENTRIRHQFIQMFTHHLTTVFDSSRVLAIIDSTRDHIISEMPAHFDRWHHIESVDVWDENLDALRLFARNRPSYCIRHLRDNFNLREPVPVTFIVKQPEFGRIEVNHLPQPSDSFTLPLFPDIPYSIRAIPAPGYAFAGWSGALVSDADSTNHSVDAPSVITAEFVSRQQSILPSVILKNMHLSSSESPYYVREDVVIDSNAILSVDAGVTFYLADSVSFLVYGALHFDGEDAHPIIIKPDNASSACHIGSICFLNPTATSRLHHVHLENATINRAHPKEYFASITAFHADLDLDHVTLYSSNQPFYAEYGTTVITNSSFRSPATCDLINVKYGKAEVNGCDLKGNYAIDTDAIDYDGITGGIISGNTIHDFYGGNSDGIDIGEESQNIIIQDNLIYNCSDKAVSVGQASTVTLERNTILNCDLGIGVKDSGSSANLDRNTFHANRIAVAAYEKNAGAGGGRITVKNSILSESAASALLVDDLSTIETSYCIATSDTLPGQHNLFGSPLFISPETGDFTLQSSSPCIDAGDPSSSPDPDNSPADIGACFFPRQIIINEINLNYRPEFNPGTWIELTNTGNDTIDLGGWSLSSVNMKWSVTITDDQKIPPGAFYVVPGRKKHFQALFNNIDLISTNRSFSLSKHGETLLLQNESGVTVDSVAFTNDDPWPHLSMTDIRTLSLRSTGSDNTDPKNWFIAQQPGTPGRANVAESAQCDIVINEINYNASPVFNTGDWIELYNGHSWSVDLSGWKLTDNDSTHSYTFPVNTRIEPENFLVVCRDQRTFGLFFPEVQNLAGDFNFGLGTENDQIRLLNTRRHLVDSVSFGTASPWPTEPNGSGTTLELINPLLDNTVAESWGASVDPSHGTPGAVNSIFHVSDTSEVLDSIPTVTQLHRNYPNPFNDVTTIPFTVSPDDSGIIDISLFNIHGQFVKNMKHEKLPPGSFFIRLKADHLASGTYFLRLSTGCSFVTKEIIVLK